MIVLYFRPIFINYSTPRNVLRFISVGMRCYKTGLGFVCFVVINPRALSANRVDLGFFCFSNFPILLPPPPPQYKQILIPFKIKKNAIWCCGFNAAVLPSVFATVIRFKSVNFSLLISSIVLLLTHPPPQPESEDPLQTSPDEFVKRIPPINTKFDSTSRQGGGGVK